MSYPPDADHVFVDRANKPFVNSACGTLPRPSDRILAALRLVHLDSLEPSLAARIRAGRAFEAQLGSNRG